MSTKLLAKDQQTDWEDSSVENIASSANKVPVDVFSLVLRKKLRTGRLIEMYLLPSSIGAPFTNNWLVRHQISMVISTVTSMKGGLVYTYLLAKAENSCEQWNTLMFIFCYVCLIIIFYFCEHISYQLCSQQAVLQV